MKKFLLLLPSIILLLLPPSVLAHTTETDGDISLTIHFDPEDDPIVGEQTGFYFAFKDKTNRFKPTECNCIFNVIKDGTEVYSQPLFKDNTHPDLNNVSVVYTFPERNVYQVKVVGKPVTKNAFQAFNLTYTIRVERTSQQQQANPQEDGNTSWLDKHFAHPINVLIALGVFGAFVIFAVIQKRKEKPNVRR